MSRGTHRGDCYSAFFIGMVVATAALAGLMKLSGTDPIGVQKKWEQELIDRGHAEYNTTTGEWQWKEQGDD